MHKIPACVFTMGVCMKDNITESKAIKQKNNFNLEDAELLAYMATKITHTYATNGRHYWYYIFEDIKECDFITYLFNRNGLYPKLHYSHYLGEYKINPVLRIRSKYINKNSDVKDFVSLITASRNLLLNEGNGIHNHQVLAMNDFLKRTR